MTGNSNNFTKPKSSPVASERPLDERLAQLTSALSAFRGHTPITSLPRTLKNSEIKINTYNLLSKVNENERKQKSKLHDLSGRHPWSRHAIFPKGKLRGESQECPYRKLENRTTYLVQDAHVILLISFLSFKGFPPGTVNTSRS